uniref:WD repeat and coiled-coil-containing protein n=1 Tax=Neogobius melanostomus TaxID=47308 RepID=A0A8C6WGG9_9GOBI
MDLGKAKLLRTGVNTLHQAIHPVHGVAWTDGKQVCLTTLYFINGEVKFGDTNVIGQFEHVLGLYWGPMCCLDSPALLAVQHKKHITVWQLQLSTLEQNKLLCTQTCEMSEPFPLLSQGCVWHPKLDVLAVLTKRDTSVLFSVRVDNRRIKADIKGSGLIHCACWTKDGTRLVVAIGSALHSYIWNDIQKSIMACSFCPIFDIGGYVCAMESTGEAQVAVATELPLDKLCGLNAGMAFDLPTDAESIQSQVSQGSEEDSVFDRRRSFSERSFIPSSGPLDITHLLARHRRSDPSPLMHLRRRDTVTGSGLDSSHLILVTYERKVTTSRKVSIPGILVPDIVAFDPRGSTVAVASNTSNMVLVYRITPSAMPNIQQVSLQANDRPKGVCFLGDKMLLLMVGRQKSMILLSFQLRTQINTCFEEADRGGEKHRVQPHLQLSGLLGQILRQGRIQRLLHHFGEFRHGPREPHVQPGGGGAGQPGLQSCQLPGASRAPGQAPHQPDDGLDRKDVEPERARPGAAGAQHGEAFTRFSDVQQCLAEMRDYTQNGKKAQSVYPPSTEPSYVNVTCQKQLSENVFTDERRPVLLCDGKLCLRALQDLFSLTTVEMLYGPIWIVLVADPDGFVPLTFKSKDELTVRNVQKPPAPPVLRPVKVTQTFDHRLSSK